MGHKGEHVRKCAATAGSRRGHRDRQQGFKRFSTLSGSFRAKSVHAGLTRVRSTQVQLPQFRHEGLQVTAIYSRSMDRAITLAAEVRCARGTASRLRT